VEFILKGLSKREVRQNCGWANGEWRMEKGEGRREKGERTPKFIAVEARRY
jgi:hypothetical protein